MSLFAGAFSSFFTVVRLGTFVLDNPVQRSIQSLHTGRMLHSVAPHWEGKFPTRMGTTRPTGPGGASASAVQPPERKQADGVAKATAAAKVNQEGVAPGEHLKARRRVVWTAITAFL